MSYFTLVAVVVGTIVVLAILRRRIRRKSGTKRLSFVTMIKLVFFIVKRRWKLRAVLKEEKNSPVFRPSTRMVSGSGFPESFGSENSNFWLPPGAKAKNVEELCDKVKLLPDDIVVACYPKSGTTWTQNIVKLIRSRGVEDGKDLEEVSPWVDMMTLEEVEV